MAPSPHPGDAPAAVTVHGALYSVYVRIACLALEEKRVAYSIVPVDIFAGSPETVSYLRLNPFGRIPALVHDGFVLYETRAITRYVDEAFDGPALQPPDVRDRARMDQAIGVVDSYAYRTLVWDLYVAHTARAKGEGPEHADRISAALPRARTCLDEFARLIGDGRYFGGASLSLADLHVAPVFGYVRTVPEALALLREYPGLTDWWSRFSARDSWRVVAQDPAG